MAISSSDLIFRKPERLTDFPDGGGRMVWDPVPDGVVNNLFNDVASGDRVFGRASLRTMFTHVSTPNTDILAQAIGIIIQRPQDPAVSVVMFSTGSSVDVRDDARRVIESFRLMANESPYTLYSDHPPGTQVLSVYGREGMPEPNIGDVFYLSVEASGHAARQERVKVQSILYHETEEFEDSQGIFKRDVMQIELTRPLEALLGAFIGQQPVRNYSIRPPTRVRASRPNQSAQFYGTQQLENDITASPESKVYEIKVPSIFQPLVPATQSESPVTDVLAGQGTESYVQSGETAALSLSFSVAVPAATPAVRFFGSPIVRRSLLISAGGQQLADDGDGHIVPAPGEPVTNFGGTVDYATGRIEITHSVGVGSTAFTVTATPAGQVVRQSFTQQIAISALNQQNAYIFQLTPFPAAGTVIIDYRSQGQWYRLVDNGRGGLAGNEGEGVGSVNYATGSVSITIPAQPDIDSAVIAYWGTTKTTERRNGDSEIEAPYITYTVEAPAISPGSLEIAYLVSSSPVELTDDGEGNVVDGSLNVVGQVIYATGEIGFRPPTLPDVSSQIAYAYDRSDQQTQAEALTASGGGEITMTLAGGNVRAGSVRLRYFARLIYNAGGGFIGDDLYQIDVRDDGAGNLNGNIMGAAGVGGPDSVTGTINYTTGEIVLVVEGNYSFWLPTYGYVNGRWTVTGYSVQNAGFFFDPDTTVTANWQQSAAGEVPQLEEVDLPPVTVDLTPGITDSVVPGSVRFVFKGQTYVDRSGTLVRAIDPLNNSATPAGTMDYATGRATITSWTAGGSNTIQIVSLLTSSIEPGVSSVFFRTPGSPLAPGSFTIRATLMDGSTLITGTSDINGNISGTKMRGTIDWTTGVAAVEFGELVTAVGNEAEPWYDPDLIVGGQIFRPELVLPASIFFGVVVYSYVPVSPVILGLDPIGLPNDGRVPIYRVGQQLVLIDERETEVDSPTADQVVDLMRTNLSQVEVRTAAGVPVESEYYDLDLDAGTVTFADTLPPGWVGYAQPLKIRHRVDVRRGISKVQITGHITLNAGIDRDFEAETTLVCSALVLGERYGSPDIQARVTTFFDQEVDEIGIFKPELVGDPATASYNRAVYPIQVTNRGALTQRWKLRFTGATTFVVIGEDVGQIEGVFSTSEDCAPINPITITDTNPSGDPYFVIEHEGWGAGWIANNILRFDTVGAEPKIWFVRVTQPSDPSDLPQDLVRFQAIGDD